MCSTRSTLFPFLDDALTGDDGLARTLAATVLAKSPTAEGVRPLLEALEIAIRWESGGESQHAVLFALLESKRADIYPVLAEQLDRIGSDLNAQIAEALMAKELPGGPSTRTAMNRVLREKAIHWHPTAARVLASTGGIEDFFDVFDRVGPEGRSLMEAGVRAHLESKPADWSKWAKSPDPRWRLFALVHADLSADTTRATTVVSLVTDRDSEVSRWAAFPLDSHYSNTHPTSAQGYHSEETSQDPLPPCRQDQRRSRG